MVNIHCAQKYVQFTINIQVYSSTYKYTVTHTTVQLIRLVLAVHYIVTVHAVWQTGAVVAVSEWQYFLDTDLPLQKEETQHLTQGTPRLLVQGLPLGFLSSSLTGQCGT